MATGPRTPPAGSPRHPPPPPAGVERPDGPASFAGGRSAAIAADLQRARDTCLAYAPRDRADCLRDYLGWAARRIPQYGAYSGVRQALLDASLRIDAIVEANADPATPARRFRVKARGFTSVSSSPIRRVRAARLARVNRETSAVIDELATSLLRSADTGALKRADLDRVAQAVDSTKVLLRSS